jgi:thioredoxin reductase (NADPH)
VSERGSSVLSPAQIATLAEHGEEHAAEVGDVLFEVGDEIYPFIVILEGEAAVLDGAGGEIVRHGPSGFLGEMNLLSGQTVFLRAVVTEPMRYIAVDRDVLRRLLAENSSLSDLLLPAFVRRREILQQRQGVGIEVLGSRESADTLRILEWARRARIPHGWLDPDEDESAAAAIAGHDEEQLPIVRLPGGADLERPSNGELSRALGIGLTLNQSEQVDLVIVGAGPAGLGAAVYGASEGLDTLVVESTAVGGQAGLSRRIENYLGFPAGISGTELTSRAVSQARKFGARTATPYAAKALVAGDELHTVQLEDGHEIVAPSVVVATGANYRRLPIDDLDRYEGVTVFYAAGPPEGRLCEAQHVGVVGGGNSAGQAAIWLAGGGARVTLLHRRADLAETMSHYLLDDLKRAGVSIRDRSEIADLHEKPGEPGELEAVTLTDGTRLELSFLFCFLGAAPCTDWLGDAVARDEHGFVLTGPDAGADGLLETSVPGIYAAGDVRSGSIKRCATAVGEGAAVVRFVHERGAAATPAGRR